MTFFSVGQDVALAGANVAKLFSSLLAFCQKKLECLVSILGLVQYHFILAKCHYLTTLNSNSDITCLVVLQQHDNEKKQLYLL